MTKLQDALSAASSAIINSCAQVKTSTIYHYTSTKGLLGIFENDSPTLYFSQYDSLNDPNERKDVFEVLHKYCAQQKENKKMSQELYERITSIKPSDLFGFVFETNEQKNSNTEEYSSANTVFSLKEGYTYICSFTRKRDFLPMWKMYTKTENNEGFCIGFRTYEFAHKKYSTEGFRLQLIEVVYDEKTKNDLIESVLSHIMEVYDSATQNDKESCIVIVKMMINEFQFMFKNKHFAYEEEIRAVLQVPKEQKRDITQITKRKHRDNNGLIVPYVEYSMKSSSVINITIAPTIKEEIAVSNLKDYLWSKNLSHIHIISSDIPIRTI